MPLAASLNSTNVRKLFGLMAQRTQLKVASVLAPQRAVEKAMRLFSTPPRHAHRPRELELLATGVRLDIDAPGARLAAWRFGAAHRPAVVASHGWGGRGAQFSAFVPALLGAGYQVIVFDHAGHGLSTGSDSSLIHFERDLEAVARHLSREGARIAALIGHSLGAAAIGAWLNATRGEARVVLIAPPVSIERYSTFFARRLGLAERVRREMQSRLEERLGRRWSEFELPASVGDVRAAALVIHDHDDREVSFASGLTLARAWRGARFVATQGLGHRAILRDPQVVADSVDFIAGRVVFAPPPAPGEASAFRSPAPIA